MIESLHMLGEVAQTSKNDALEAAFAVFSDLADDQQLRLVGAIHVLENSPDVSDTGGKIRGSNSRSRGSTEPGRTV